MLGHGEQRMPLIEASSLPFTLGGRARHNVENALAAFAALIAIDIPCQRVAAAMSSFTSSPQHNPLRLNLFRVRGVTLLVDYAHNAAAYRAIIDTAQRLTSQRMIGVVAAPGDRRADDIVEMGRICGEGFDQVLVYEMDDLRNQPAGVTAQRMQHGALQVPCTPRKAPPRVVLDVREAIREALRAAHPGDVVVLGCASHLDELRDALAGQADGAALSVVASAEDPASAHAPLNLQEENALET
jgi:cyanophycin synthetase